MKIGRLNFANPPELRALPPEFQARNFQKRQLAGPKTEILRHSGNRIGELAEIRPHNQTYKSTNRSNLRMFYLFELIRTLEGDYSHG